MNHFSRKQKRGFVEHRVGAGKRVRNWGPVKRQGPGKRGGAKSDYQREQPVRILGTSPPSLHVSALAPASIRVLEPRSGRIKFAVSFVRLSLRSSVSHSFRSQGRVALLRAELLGSRCWRARRSLETVVHLSST